MAPLRSNNANVARPQYRHECKAPQHQRSLQLRPQQQRQSPRPLPRLRSRLTPPRPRCQVGPLQRRVGLVQWKLQCSLATRSQALVFLVGGVLILFTSQLGDPGNRNNAACLCRHASGPLRRLLFPPQMSSARLAPSLRFVLVSLCLRCLQVQITQVCLFLILTLWSPWFQIPLLARRPPLCLNPRTMTPKLPRQYLKVSPRLNHFAFRTLLLMRALGTHIGTNLGHTGSKTLQKYPLLKT